ncbi:hypothetical protein [Stenotrophomonas oahuensis]|uniref:Secreted protein n=1 Tax=Stenotrophomonas oahuensis TaxID=3003271 RepID=A0ABY9YSP5_9GAMM|nr:hypothetical protein [Stenotrophomonas sp. A5586]WNH53595.1 hypothetical protein PDM29_04755 [Stenotrophomonas sp. A5586]
MGTIRFTTALLAIAAATSCAPNPTQAEGLTGASSRSTGETTHVYVTQGGWGELLLSETRKNDLLRFELHSNSSGYECRMSGTTNRSLQSTHVDPAPGTSHCPLTMHRTERGIELDTSTPDACAAYCGHNGSFKGLYLSVDPMCTEGSIQKTLERAGTGKGQLGTIRTMTERCVETLPYSSVAALRLELAAAHDREGDQANCLAALSPYAADVAKSNDELTQGMAGAAAEEITGIMDVVRKMMDRCERKLPPGSVGR